MKKNEPNWLVVLRTVMPLGLSYIPIGLACGVLLHAAGFNHLLTALISVMVFSGGAQFLIASMLTINAPMTTIILMMFFLELRYALLVCDGQALEAIAGLNGRTLFVIILDGK